MSMSLEGMEKQPLLDDRLTDGQWLNNSFTKSVKRTRRCHLFSKAGMVASGVFGAGALVGTVVNAIFAFMDDNPAKRSNHAIAAISCGMGGGFTTVTGLCSRSLGLFHPISAEKEKFATPEGILEICGELLAVPPDFRNYHYMKAMNALSPEISQQVEDFFVRFNALQARQGEINQLLRSAQAPENVYEVCPFVKEMNKEMEAAKAKFNSDWEAFCPILKRAFPTFGGGLILARPL